MTARAKPQRPPRKLKPIQWGDREELLLVALQERAAVEGVEAATFADAVRVAMAVAVEATGPAWARVAKKAEGT